jgi:glutamine synthetase
VAGLSGVDGAIDPGLPSDEPYGSDQPLLPRSLMEALDALEKDALFRKELGAVFIDYFLKLKRNETGRYLRWLEERGLPPDGDETTEWEQNEYFDFF